MNAVFSSLGWCVLQVTLVALLAWILCGLARRLSPQGAASLPLAALAAVIVLTALAFVPWPAGWSYGPSWDWRPLAVKDEQQPKVVVRVQPFPAAPMVEREPTAAPAAAPLSFPVIPELEVQPQIEQVSTEREAVPQEEMPSPKVPTSAAVAATSWNWQSLLLFVIAMGAGLGFLQLFAGLAVAQRYRRKSCRIDDPDLRELGDVLCAQLRCTRAVELRETSALATAATMGWLRPLVLLPRGWREWSSEQQKAVLAHEIAHIARHDFLACILAQAGLALHFYHPLVHWLVRRLRLEQELAADASAAVVAGGRAIYLQALAELALRQSEQPLGWPARTFLPTRGTFMRRIEMLRDAKNLPAGESRWLTWPRRLAVLLLILGAAALAGLRGAGPAAPEVAQAQDKPKAKVESKASEEPKAAQPDAGEISLAHLPSDCLAFAALRIQPLLANPETGEVLRKLDQRSAASKAAVPLEKIAQIAFAMRSNERIQGSEPVIIVEATEPVDFSKSLLMEEDGKQGGLEEVKEADLEPGIGPATIVFTRLGDRAAAFGNRQTLASYFARKHGAPPMARGDGWKQISQRPLVFAIDMMALRRMVPPGEGPEQTLTSMRLMPFWDEPESIAVGVSLEKKADIRLVADCLGEKGATEVAQIADVGAVALRRILREMRSAQIKQVADNLGARTIEEPEFVRLVYDAADKALSNVKVERQEALIVASATIDLKGRVGALSALVPSMGAMRVSSRRAQAANNLKQIMLAMHNYADTYGGKFPPAIIYGKDGKGKVPHSWRVELLPYLEQPALYNEYQFDEPWDSEANKKVLAKMPAVFHDPGDDPKSIFSAYYVMIGKMEAKKDEGGGAGAAAPGETAPAGPPGGVGAPPPGAAAGVFIDTALPTAFSKNGGKEGIRFGEIIDGTSNTIAVVEAKRDIPWTKPEDISFDPKGKLPKLGGFYADGFNVGICDGSVNFLPGNILPESLRAYLSPAAGDQIAPQKGNPIATPRGNEVDRPSTPKPLGR